MANILYCWVQQCENLAYYQWMLITMSFLTPIGYKHLNINASKLSHSYMIYCNCASVLNITALYLCNMFIHFDTISECDGQTNGEIVIALCIRAVLTSHGAMPYSDWYNHLTLATAASKERLWEQKTKYSTTCEYNTHKQISDVEIQRKSDSITYSPCNSQAAASAGTPPLCAEQFWW